DLIANETMSPAMAELLEACVRAGKNIIVAGGAGAGKTTLLNCLAAGIPTEERIITIEDGCELVLPQENVVTLETRSATDGQPEIGSGQLVGFAQRLRPDRLVVGDLSGEDALELLRAMNSGCGGVLSCVHAQDAHGALERMETMCLMGGRDLPVRTLRELISTGMDLLVVLTRYSSGERKVTGIFEVASLDVDLVNLEEIFRFEAEGTDRNGAVLGRFRATGFVPRLFDDLQRRGLAPSPDVFR
ncbi:MAG: CpaF family protein, partial [Deltaproteobacteria bacterium]|nr:CpaF family protein [Deltaproteobacteria bacterium]